MSIGRKIAQMRTNLAAALGYTPVNKAGDTMSGKLVIQSSGNEADRSLRLAYDSTYYSELVQLGAGGCSIRNGNATDLLKVDWGGRVTMPNQIGFFVGTSQGTISAANTLPYQLNDSSGRITYNVGGWWNDSGSKFTAPIAGMYEFKCHVVPTGNSQGNTSELWLAVNGGGIRYFFDRRVKVESNNNGFSMNGTVTVKLAANDYVTAVAGSTNGTLELSSWFSGRLRG